ncbi:hypothetical protein BLA29_011397, partial [Euroglyphus maynei]
PPPSSLLSNSNVPCLDSLSLVDDDDDDLLLSAPLSSPFVVVAVDAPDFDDAAKDLDLDLEDDPLTDFDDFDVDFVEDFADVPVCSLTLSLSSASEPLSSSDVVAPDFDDAP